ncbi:hypothetical protein ZIOFF_058738 [Zingiber officinale]|uniref:Uncharacterized protein n=1 Tax=Zingiber officinale TaxID=94328 RepID=A0A8J5FGZ0_ZINOF|nr:hypothetical protein ZIOFF_058738 [Zingiber officinale]
MQLGDAGPAAGATAGPLLPFCDSPALVSSDSGVFFPSASRKRPREDSSSSHVHRQLLDLNRLVVDHVARLRAELVGRLRRILAAAEEGASKRLRAKEEEVELARKVALALEERLKSLSIENQMWRELARSGEAAVCALQSVKEDERKEFIGAYLLHLMRKYFKLFRNGLSDSTNFQQGFQSFVPHCQLQHHPRERLTFGEASFEAMLDQFQAEWSGIRQCTEWSTKIARSQLLEVGSPLAS